MKMDLHKSVKGYFQLFEDIGIIYINDLYCEREQIITAAHELGHYFLHGNSEVLYLRNNTLNMPSAYELEANTFASEFLVDDSIFNEYTDYCMNHIASIAGVPEEFIDLKYKRLFL
jgi:Zn-dependent peptidase ImmA (M78 family)